MHDPFDPANLQLSPEQLETITATKRVGTDQHCIMDRCADLDSAFRCQAASQAAQHLGAVALHWKVPQRARIGVSTNMTVSFLTPAAS
jgi:hypothetical protein